MMSDEKAIELANLLAQYTRDSIAEGATQDEVVDWTVRELLTDIVGTTSVHLEHTIDPLAMEIAG